MSDFHSLDVSLYRINDVYIDRLSQEDEHAAEDDERANEKAEEDKPKKDVEHQGSANEVNVTLLHMYVRMHAAGAI